jgi:hypothetical protein
MSQSDYAAAIASIATDELDGEDVTARIAQIASICRLEAADVRQAVTDHQQD